VQTADVTVPAPVWSREWDLLLACARLAPDEGAVERIRALSREDLDWDVVLGTAHRHRVLPLVHRSLAGNAADRVPPAIRERLRYAAQRNARRSLFLTGELLQVVELLRTHDIRSIPYKGPALAALAYGDPSLRQYADLDVIVPARDVVRARALLVDRGYRPERPATDEQLLAWIDGEKDITLLHDGRGVTLEIHWGITSERDPVRIPPEWLWRHLETCTVAGRQVPTLDAADLFLILCIHGAKHRWERLGWLCDIAEIVRVRPSLEWTRMRQDAVGLGCGRMLLLGVSLATELLGAGPPADVRRACRDDVALTGLAAEVKAWMFGDSPAELSLGEREQFFMRLRERPVDRLLLATSQAKRYLAPTSRDVEALPLPSFLRWAHYVVRPFRLAAEYGFGPFKRFVRGLLQS
jgi:hypothetical protein